MAGRGRLPVQPSSLSLPAIGASQPQRGIPTAGGNFGPAVGGQPDLKNLLAASPPTLLEAYEFVSYAIGFSAWVVSGAAWNPLPNITVDMQILVNDRAEHFDTLTKQSTVEPGATTGAYVTSAFVADLVNPIQLGARDRLGLLFGVTVDQSTASTGVLTVGIQFVPNVGYYPYESFLSYDVIDLPGSRRL